MRNQHKVMICGLPINGATKTTKIYRSRKENQLLYFNVYFLFFNKFHKKKKKKKLKPVLNIQNVIFIG